MNIVYNINLRDLSLPDNGGPLARRLRAADLASESFERVMPGSDLWTKSARPVRLKPHD